MSGLFPAVSRRQIRGYLISIDHEITIGTACASRAREIHFLAASDAHCGNHHRRCGGLSAGASRRFCVGVPKGEGRLEPSAMAAVAASLMQRDAQALHCAPVK